MTNVPDMDPRWPRLLAAARAWKATLIPKTSTGTAGPTNNLIEAIDAFEECDHPRAQRVFHPRLIGEPVETCGKCGAEIPNPQEEPCNDD